MTWNRLEVGDCLDLLPALPSGSADLVFADPPFNIGYQYDSYRDRRTKSDYLKWVEAWLQQVRRIVSPTGAVWIAIGDEYAAEYKIRLDDLGLTLRNWVVWHYTFGVNCQKKFNRSHAHIFYYVVDPKRFTFDADAIRVPSARQTTYADKRAFSKGKLPDDTWVLRPQETGDHFSADSDTWFGSRVCGTFKERLKADDESGHPCQMPESILERIIRVSSQPGETVVDPFAGSGTTLAVAKRLGRRWFGCELSEGYAGLIQQRLQSVEVVTETARAEVGAV